jgi:hypothetical protein
MHTESLHETQPLFLGKKFGNVGNEAEYKMEHLALDGSAKLHEVERD